MKLAATKRSPIKSALQSTPNIAGANAIGQRGNLKNQYIQKLSLISIIHAALPQFIFLMSDQRWIDLVVTDKLCKKELRPESPVTILQMHK